MDQTEKQKLQSLGQFMKSQFHGNIFHLILSVSVFSLLFSHSYWLSLLHCFSFNFHNTLPFQLFSHNIDKNCIFLLFNGLLVFLAKFSGLITPSNYNNPSVLDQDDDDNKSFNSFEDVLVLEPKAPLLQENEALNSTLMEETEEDDKEEEEEDGEKWGLNIVMTNAEELEENTLFVGEDNEDLEWLSIENHDKHRVLSTDDELNKRFDEFIRKMKEDLRIEARQQLVMV